MKQINKYNYSNRYSFHRYDYRKLEVVSGSEEFRESIKMYRGEEREKERDRGREGKKREREPLLLHDVDYPEVGNHGKSLGSKNSRK